MMIHRHVPGGISRKCVAKAPGRYCALSRRFPQTATLIDESQQASREV